jgi:hypothetical protein
MFAIGGIFAGPQIVIIHGQMGGGGVPSPVDAKRGSQMLVSLPWRSWLAKPTSSIGQDERLQLLKLTTRLVATNRRRRMFLSS